MVRFCRTGRLKYIALNLQVNKLENVYNAVIFMSCSHSFWNFVKVSCYF